LSKAVADTGYSATLRDLLEPALFMIGDRWAADGLSLAQGFVAGKIAEDFLELGKDFWKWDDSSGMAMTACAQDCCDGQRGG
jgi:hypothetical protein